MHSVRAELVWPRPCATLTGCGSAWGCVTPPQDFTDQNDAHRAVSHEDRLKEFRLFSLERTKLQGALKALSSAHRAQSCRDFGQGPGVTRQEAVVSN